MISTSELLSGLKGAAETTRLRLLALLGGGELNVKDLTLILAQSQPRISRHLKLLNEAGLIERFREGSWVYFRLADSGAGARIARQIIALADPSDPVFARDRERAVLVRQERTELAQAYFKEHAANWDQIRALHVAEDGVEEAMQRALGKSSLGTLVDIGTGTGRILELFARQLERGVGFDINPDMLAYARTKLQAPAFRHCHVRHGDLFSLPLDKASVDTVIIHQVLHFIDEPGKAIMEAARIIKAGGRCLIVDFAPHELEFLRDEHAHRRLGFSDAQMGQWIDHAGLTLTKTIELKPKKSKGSPRLTVSVWLADKTSEEKSVRCQDTYDGAHELEVRTDA